MSNNMNYNTRADTTPVQYRDKPKFRKEYVDQLRAENDKLRAENERLREGLKEIAYHAPIHKTSWDLDDQAILDIAQQALNEVKE